MKRFFCIVTLALVCKIVFSQKEQIIYTDFYPDTSMTFWIGNVLPYPNDLFYIDFDHDGEDDFFFWGNLGNRWVMGILFQATDPYDSEWRISFCQLGDTISNIPDLGDLGDTIPNIPNDVYPPLWSYGAVYLYPEGQSFPHTYALRRKIGDDCYYGWYEASVTWDKDDLTRATVTLYKMAYCTVPNYPLRWGQTSINNNTGENPAVFFAELQPNPTTGVFSVLGDNLKQAEMVNALGQQITSVSNYSNRIFLDLSGQPAGVYFVTITDQEGRKCIKKMVKQ